MKRFGGISLSVFLLWGETSLHFPAGERLRYGRMLNRAKTYVNAKLSVSKARKPPRNANLLVLRPFEALRRLSLRRIKLSLSLRRFSTGLRKLSLARVKPSKRPLKPLPDERKLFADRIKLYPPQTESSSEGAKPSKPQRRLSAQGTKLYLLQTKPSPR